MRSQRTPGSEPPAYAGGRLAIAQTILMIKKHFIKFAAKPNLVFTLCVLCALGGYSQAQDFKQLHPGVEYAQVRKEISGLNVNINLLRLDLTQVRLDVRHAMDAAIGMEKTSSIAKRHGAVAAINAGFFRLDSSLWAGEAAGTLVIDHRTLSESLNNRIAIFIDNFDPNVTNVNFAHLDLYTLAKIGSEEFRVSGINRERKADELIEYTSEFGRTTLTDPNGVEIIVEKGKVVRVVVGGSSPIPPNGYVLSASGKLADRIRSIRIGFKVRANAATPFTVGSNGFPNKDTDRTTQAFSRAEDITNGIPQLIRDGKIEITWEQEKTSKSFVETRHPRTAVAKLKDGKFLMITVDGRSESSGGISLQDLADYLLSLGAVDAMNLDGGGSTTMYLDGKVVNTPSDKEGERRIGDAILVTLRKKQ
ncbi:MAG: phosphodiester glycosidase family protein [Blastocatellia bacterium]|nr:phosphodiester glycosidase family protein [Blastocatellia bacterium]